MGDIYSTHTGHEKLVQNFGHETWKVEITWDMEA
jgi:hypothetical protein